VALRGAILRGAKKPVTYRFTVQDNHAYHASDDLFISSINDAMDAIISHCLNILSAQLSRLGCRKRLNISTERCAYGRHSGRSCMQRAWANVAL